MQFSGEETRRELSEEALEKRELSQLNAIEERKEHDKTDLEHTTDRMRIPSFSFAKKVDVTFSVEAIP